MSDEENKTKWGGKVKIVVSKSGLPRKLFVDDVEIPYVKQAQVKMEPQNFMVLGVDIIVLDVQTIEEPDQ